MSTVIKWNASASRQVPTIARPRWREIRQGLTLAIPGLPLPLALALLGLCLVSTPSGLLAGLLRLPPEDAGVTGWVLVGTGLLAYAVVLVGQWRCLNFAPQGRGAKEVQFASLLCGLAAPPFFAIAQLLGGSATFVALQGGPAELARLDLLAPGTVLQMAGLAACLGGVLLQSAFARAVCRCLDDVAGSRGVSWYFWFVAFLVGATGGLLMQVGRATPQGVLAGLGLSWLLCLIWHSLLIHGAAGRIGRFLGGERSRDPAQAPGATPRSGQVALEAAAFLPHWK
jgi:hypothetical protein